MLYYNVLSTTPVTFISLRGRFDSSGALVFEENFKKNEFLYPVINFQEVQFLSSAGIRVLLQAEKSLRSKNGKIIFSSVPANIRQVLEITGLLQQFTLADSDEIAFQLQSKMQESVNTKFNQVIDNHNYTITRFNTEPQQVDIWESVQSDNDNLIAVNLAEFKYAIGTGGLGNTRIDVKNMQGRVLMVNNFIGVLPENEPADYLFSKDPAGTFFYINSAVNIAGSPNLVIDVMTGNALTYKKLMDNLFAVISDSFDNPAPAAGFLLIANSGLSEDILTVGFLSDRMNENIPAVIKKEEVQTDNNLFLTSLGLKLGTNNNLFPNDDINDCINSVLQDNISEVIIPSGDSKISSAKIWVFTPEFKYAQQTRLKISMEDSVKMSDEFEIITRRIYSDCSSIKLQQLHGGFSAKTFQVFGYDKRGIRILPTVLKLAKRSTVQREVNNYEENVKKYILNNSTSVMGSFFYGNSGGVRYNFVGITGPDSRICWLTNYYREKPAEELIPIFDKVFTDILRPWYGQPGLRPFTLIRNIIRPRFSSRNYLKSVKKNLEFPLMLNESTWMNFNVK
jgi:anti-anti-sigma factor